MALQVITNDRKPKKVAHIYQSFMNYPATIYTTVDADKVESKMEKLKTVFPRNNWTIRYETV